MNGCSLTATPRGGRSVESRARSGRTATCTALPGAISAGNGSVISAPERRRTLFDDATVAANRFVRPMNSATKRVAGRS